jgi:GntR family transcriptional regulator
MTSCRGLRPRVTSACWRTGREGTRCEGTGTTRAPVPRRPPLEEVVLAKDNASVGQASRRTRWVAAIRDDSDLPRRAVLVGWALATWMDQDGECFPSLATIAKAARVDKATVVRALDDLDSAGWIERDRGGSERGGTRRATRYRADLSHHLRQVVADLSQNGSRPVADQPPDLSHIMRHEGSIEVPKEGAATRINGSPSDDPPDVLAQLLDDRELNRLTEAGGSRR